MRQAGAVAEAGPSPAPCQVQQQPVSSLLAQQGICDQPRDDPRTAQHNVDNSHAAALPGISGDAGRGDAKDANHDADQAISEEKDRQPFLSVSTVILCAGTLSLHVACILVV